MEIIILVFVFFTLGLTLGGSLAASGNREKELLVYNKGYQQCRFDYHLFPEKA